MRSFAIILALFASCTAESDSIYIGVFKPFPERKGFEGMVYKIGNKVHIKTRRGTVLRLCPLKLYGHYDSAQIKSAEVAMRSYPFWGDAKIETDKNGTIKSIVVQDLWTTKIAAEFRYVARKPIWSIAFEEENLLGYGVYFTTGYSHNIERDWWHVGSRVYGISKSKIDLSALYKYHGGRWHAEVAISRRNFFEGSPFYVGVVAESLDVPIYMSGNATPNDTVFRFITQQSVELNTITCGKNLFLGIAASHFLVRRNARGWANKKTGQFLLLMPRLSFVRRKFATLYNVDISGRPEDVTTGIFAGLTFGAQLDIRDYENANNFTPTYNARVVFSNFYSKALYFGASINAYRKFDIKGFSLSTRTFAPTYTNSKFRVGVGIDYMWASAPEDLMFIADGSTGFRGYEAFYRVSEGEKKSFLRVTFELRSYPNIEILTIRPALALFADFGGVDEEIGKLPSDYLLDIGIGLRLGSTRSTRKTVNRFDLSYSPKLGTISFTLDAGQIVSFFVPMDWRKVTDYWRE